MFHGTQHKYVDEEDKEDLLCGQEMLCVSPDRCEA